MASKVCLVSCLLLYSPMLSHHLANTLGALESNDSDEGGPPPLEGYHFEDSSSVWDVGTQADTPSQEPIFEIAAAAPADPSASWPFAPNCMWSEMMSTHSHSLIRPDPLSPSAIQSLCAWKCAEHGLTTLRRLWKGGQSKLD